MSKFGFLCVFIVLAAAEIGNYGKQKKILLGSCSADRIIAKTFHIIVSGYISVKQLFLSHGFLRFGLVY